MDDSLEGAVLPLSRAPHALDTRALELESAAHQAISQTAFQRASFPVQPAMDGTHHFSYTALAPLFSAKHSISILCRLARSNATAIAHPTTSAP